MYANTPNKQYPVVIVGMYVCKCISYSQVTMLLFQQREWKKARLKRNKFNAHIVHHFFSGVVSLCVCVRCFFSVQVAARLCYGRTNFSVSTIARRAKEHSQVNMRKYGNDLFRL